MHLRRSDDDVELEALVMYASEYKKLDGKKKKI